MDFKPFQQPLLAGEQNLILNTIRRQGLIAPLLHATRGNPKHLSLYNQLNALSGEAFNGGSENGAIGGVVDITGGGASGVHGDEDDDGIDDDGGRRLVAALVASPPRRQNGHAR